MCTYAHKNATYSLPLTYVQKAALKEHHLNRLLCLTLVIKEDTINVHNCSNIQHYPAADTASLLHYSGFPSAAQACALVHQQRPRVADCLVQQAKALPGNRDSHSPCTERSRRSLTSLLRPCIFTVSSLVSVPACQLLIQLSFQSKRHFQPHSCKDVLKICL